MIRRSGREAHPSLPVHDRRSFGRLFELLLFPVSVFSQENGQTTFQFRSGFWTNLHHFLIWQAATAAPNESTGSIGLSAPQALAWRQALEFYRDRFDGDDLLQPAMVEIKNVLGDAGNSQSIVDSGLEAGLVQALEEAAPVYRALWWDEHDRSNRSRIGQLDSVVPQHERPLKARLSDTYKTKWPETRIPTDVVFHANWAGAYTTLYPMRITISSEDSDQSSPEGLELLFHEASHGLIERVRTAISRRARSLGMLLPRKSLWHAVLFYSTGEIVRQRFPGYTPYAMRHSLWERVWPDHLGALEREWKPYLDGHKDFESAINALVDDLVRGER